MIGLQLLDSTKDELWINVCQYEKSQYDACKMFPTKSGISLTEDEWTEWTAHSDDISEELKSKTAGTEYYISNEKHVGLSQHGDKVSVVDLVDESVENLKSDFTYDGKTIVKSICVYFVKKKCYQYCIVETSEVFRALLRNQLKHTKVI